MIHLDPPKKKLKDDRPVRWPISGARLSAAAHEAGMTIADLARASGLSPNTIQRHKVGRSPIRFSQYDAYKRALPHLLIESCHMMPDITRSFQRAKTTSGPRKNRHYSYKVGDRISYSVREDHGEAWEFEIVEIVGGKAPYYCRGEKGTGFFSEAELNANGKVI